MGNYTALQECYVSGSATLIPVLDLGAQALTGVFPKDPSEPVTVGPLRLVWCPDSGLLQLAHSYDLGENYGYRSELNRSMVRHLTQKVQELERFADVRPGDAVLDIGSNDATSLKAYGTGGLSRTGMDPTGGKFRTFYTDGIALVPDFFSAKAYFAAGGKPAKVVTSIAMFYDLENPIAFARQVEEVLAPGGVWHFEQSYMPSMLRMTSYDTVCHEHLEYHSLGVVRGILDAAGMRIVDVNRPLVRPAAWRLRGFMTSDLAQQVRRLEDSMRQVGETQHGLDRHLHDVRDHIQHIHHTAAALPTVIEASRNQLIHALTAAIGAAHRALAHMLEAQDAREAGILAAQEAREATALAAQEAREAAGATELRRLAAEMEHALLTLTLEAGIMGSGTPDTVTVETGRDPMADATMPPPSPRSVRRGSRFGSRAAVPWRSSAPRGT